MYRDFCYSFSFYSSLFFKEGREKGKRITKVMILSHAFLLDHSIEFRINLFWAQICVSSHEMTQCAFLNNAKRNLLEKNYQNFFAATLYSQLIVQNLHKSNNLILVNKSFYNAQSTYKHIYNKSILYILYILGKKFKIYISKFINFKYEIITVKRALV